MKDLQATGPVREGLEYQGKQRRCVCLCACVYMKERKRDTTLYPMLYPSIIQSSIYLLWFSCQVMSDSCNTMDCGPPGSSVHWISQARILEWVAMVCV